MAVGIALKAFFTVDFSYRCNLLSWDYYFLWWACWVAL